MTVVTVPTGNEEVDRQLGGGLPLPSLVLIEGDHGTGKSSVSAQFAAPAAVVVERSACSIFVPYSAMLAALEKVAEFAVPPWSVP